MYPPQRKFQPSRRFAPRRRNRLTIICAVVIALMLLLFIRNSWEDPYNYPPIPYTDRRPVKESSGDATTEDAVVERPKPAPVVPDLKPEPEPEPSSAALTDEKLEEYNIQKEEEDLGIKKPTIEVQETPKESTSPAEATEGEVHAHDDDIPVADKKEEEPVTPPVTEQAVNVHSQNPPNDGTSTAILDQPDVHWKPVPEHFPIPDDEITHLPKGTPKQIPKIQYDFGVESEEARTKRESRLKQVKDEIARAWGGYKKYAWMHDELSPVSAKYRDPFCGWAATLVDSLDTLWIAGLKEEFDEAAKAVKKIDFTITERNEIPVFETTIRYLGGLLAAFDVSRKEGGYDVLLEKAVELAEILMGIFDTPNRMPVLYYNWKPEHASQPHRAGRVGIAELATLSMEFTRLAQLTGEHKYYDAINRITDGLVEMQEAGRSQIPGLFPENLDISGCNRTATTLRIALSKVAQQQLDSADTQEEPLGYVPGSDLTSETSGTEAVTSGDENDGSSTVQHRRRDTADFTEELKTTGQALEIDVERELSDAPAPAGEELPTTETAPAPVWEGEPEVAHGPPFAADGSTSKWECVPQGIVPAGYGMGTFHMGGGQDSAYEYFPKEWLLLGGLEPKYQKLYEDSVKAINEWLLYRPMVPDEWDALFTAKVSMSGQPDEDYDPRYEVTHLTCFIGGMYGLGGKIFGREDDIEIAKKMTDGCVWAYDSMPSGLMPEHGFVAACPTLEKCDYNETLWWEKLDTTREWREKEIARWDEREEEERQASLAQPAAIDLTHHTQGESMVGDGHLVEDLHEHEHSAHEIGSTEDETPSSSGSLRKRASIPPPSTASSEADEDVGSELPDSLKKKLGLDVAEKPKEADPPVVDESPPIVPEDQGTDETPTETINDPTQEFEKPTVPWGVGPNRIRPQPERPLDHETFVKQKIDSMGLTSGWTEIQGRQYILRYI